MKITATQSCNQKRHRTTVFPKGPNAPGITALDSVVSSNVQSSTIIKRIIYCGTSLSLLAPPRLGQRRIYHLSHRQKPSSTAPWRAISAVPGCTHRRLIVHEAICCRGNLDWFQDSDSQPSVPPMCYRKVAVYGVMTSNSWVIFNDSSMTVIFSWVRHYWVGSSQLGHATGSHSRPDILDRFADEQNISFEPTNATTPRLSVSPRRPAHLASRRGRGFATLGGVATSLGFMRRPFMFGTGFPTHAVLEPKLGMRLIAVEKSVIPVASYA